MVKYLISLLIISFSFSQGECEDGRYEEEIFIDCVSRIGLDPFKKHVYQNLEAVEWNHN